MARTRSTARSLRTVFDVAPDPIYVVDERRRLVFCNKACAAWLDCDPSEVAGTGLAYTAGNPQKNPSAITERSPVAGLCPPPEAFGGDKLEGFATVWRTEGGLVARTAEFVPLGSNPNDCAGVVVFVSGEDLSPEAAQHAQASEPIDEKLHLAVADFFARQRVAYGLDRLIGETPAIERVRKQVELAACSAANILICGPAGSGREHVARAIHYRRNAIAEAGLVPLDGRLLNVELVESTLHSLLVQHERCRLLIADVDRCPPEVQQHLLQVVRHPPMPLEFLATAEKDLTVHSAAAEFLPELAAAFATLVIELPPLRDRLEDLPLLAQCFIESLNEGSEKQVSHVNPEALDLLALHVWPANLDELFEVLRHAHETTRTEAIEKGDLPERLHHAARVSASPEKQDETIELESFLEAVEKQLIERALRLAQGNKAQAARLLTMPRAKLYRRMQQLGLDE